MGAFVPMSLYVSLDYCHSVKFLGVVERQLCSPLVKSPNIIDLTDFGKDISDIKFISRYSVLLASVYPQRKFSVDSLTRILHVQDVLIHVRFVASQEPEI